LGEGGGDKDGKIKKAQRSNGKQKEKWRKDEVVQVGVKCNAKNGVILENGNARYIVIGSN
jgi:hypothetical protein